MYLFIVNIAYMIYNIHNSSKYRGGDVLALKAKRDEVVVVCICI